MKIDSIQGGFIQWEEDHPCVERIECCYAEKRCTVYFHQGPPKTVTVDCSIYNSQYGLPVSEDGTLLFFSDWDTGLYAYDTDSGMQIWACRAKHITSIFVCSQHLVALQQGHALLRINIETGEVFQTFRDEDMTFLYPIDEESFLVSFISGSLCAVNKKDLSIYKRYEDNVANPRNCLSLLVQHVRLHDNILSIAGVEDDENGIYKRTVTPPQEFDRIIDPCFRHRGQISPIQTIS